MSWNIETVGTVESVVADVSKAISVSWDNTDLPNGLHNVIAATQDLIRASASGFPLNSNIRVHSFGHYNTTIGLGSYSLNVLSNC